MRALEIKTAELTEFIASKEIAVLRLNAGTSLGFNSYLQSRLESQLKTPIATAWMNTLKTDYSDLIIRKFINEWLPSIGVRSSFFLFPGYYLFKNSKLIAYHPGTIEPEKIDPRIQNIATLLGLIGGLVVGFASNSAERGLLTFTESLEIPQATKVFEFFINILAKQNKSNTQNRQQTVYEEQILSAYRILGVSPDVSEAELIKAYRELMKKYHPDASQTNKEERTKISAEINQAYELIKKTRVKARAKANKKA